MDGEGGRRDDGGGGETVFSVSDVPLLMFLLLQKRDGALRRGESRRKKVKREKEGNFSKYELNLTQKPSLGGRTQSGEILLYRAEVKKLSSSMFLSESREERIFQNPAYYYLTIITAERASWKNGNWS